MYNSNSLNISSIASELSVLASTTVTDLNLSLRTLLSFETRFCCHLRDISLGVTHNYYHPVNHLLLETPQRGMFKIIGFRVVPSFYPFSTYSKKMHHNYLFVCSHCSKRNLIIQIFISVGDI